MRKTTSSWEKHLRTEWRRNKERRGAPLPLGKPGALSPVPTPGTVPSDASGSCSSPARACGGDTEEGVLGSSTSTGGMEAEGRQSLPQGCSPCDECFHGLKEKVENPGNEPSGKRVHAYKMDLRENNKFQPATATGCTVPWGADSILNLHCA